MFSSQTDFCSALICCSNPQCYISKLFTVYCNTLCFTEDHDLVSLLTKQFLGFSRCCSFAALGTAKFHPLLVIEVFFCSIMSPQVTFVDWNPNESEADGCYRIWSLSHLLSRAKKSLIHALIFRQDWFYSDINDVQFCGSFNHRHPCNIQQKTSVLLLTQSLSAALCKVSRPGFIFK